MIDSSPCTIQNINNTQIICKAGAHKAGSYPLVVQVSSNGYTDSNNIFTYNLVVNSISSQEGSYGGGLELTLIGDGFDDLNTSITICNTSCRISNTSNSSIQCIVCVFSYNFS